MLVTVWFMLKDQVSSNSSDAFSEESASSV